ncbi:PREDICTED: protein FAM185A [Cyprinodon variegatus]|uniref:Family with sequence similarity 185 member A n=1 Tax=Cyprinodon variegatus TaxID=28743 RepID=A0A3Q2GDT9_CYPVA|nr:PREDICTED: protein FAM185A [Cyprinodon variegatus]
MFWTSVAQRGSTGLLLRCLSSKSSSTALAAPRCPMLISRYFSSSDPAKTPTHEGEEGSSLRQWALTVSPFTTVRARLGCNICIRPLDVHSYPEADQALISVHGGGQRDCMEQLHVHYDEQSQELRISAEKVNSNVTIEMDAPIKSNLFITTQGGGSVQVKKMECDICKVQTEKGSCLLHSVKGHQVEVQSQGGHVTGVGTIHGNVDIQAKGDGVVDIKKLQGTRMNVSTERGALKVKAIYAESSCVSSRSGRVELGHVHGNTTVSNESGDTVVDGSNSSLKVSSISGSIDVYVGDSGTAELHSQDGAVSVRVPPSLRAGVNLCGASVDISSEVLLHEEERNASDGQITLTGYMNGEPPVDQWVKARAERGSIKLTTQSWFESLKLGS